MYPSSYSSWIISNSSIRCSWTHGKHFICKQPGNHIFCHCCWKIKNLFFKLSEGSAYWFSIQFSVIISYTQFLTCSLFIQVTHTHSLLADLCLPYFAPVDIDWSTKYKIISNYMLANNKIWVFTIHLVYSSITCISGTLRCTGFLMIT